jgi:hypothetical protein
MIKQILLVAAFGVAALADPNATANKPQTEAVAAMSELPTDTWQNMEAAITNLMLGKSSFGATPMGGSVKKIKHLITKDMMPKVLPHTRPIRGSLTSLLLISQSVVSSRTTAFVLQLPPRASTRLRVVRTRVAERTRRSS